MQVDGDLKCIDNIGHEVEGTKLHVWSCEKANKNQLFGLAPLGGEKFITIAAHKSGRCLSVANGSREVGAFIQQSECKGKDEQAWELFPAKGAQKPWELLDPEAHPWFGLRNKKSGKCLSLHNKKNEYGSKYLVQSNCSEKDSDQRFRRWK